MTGNGLLVLRREITPHYLRTKFACLLYCCCCEKRRLIASNFEYIHSLSLCPNAYFFFLKKEKFESFGRCSTQNEVDKSRRVRERGFLSEDVYDCQGPETGTGRPL